MLSLGVGVDMGGMSESAGDGTGAPDGDSIDSIHCGDGGLASLDSLTIFQHQYFRSGFVRCCRGRTAHGCPVWSDEAATRGPGVVAWVSR